MEKQVPQKNSGELTFELSIILENLLFHKMRARAIGRIFFLGAAKRCARKIYLSRSE